ncbi:MAG: glutamine synthetase family protein, partial [Eisenbergiella sp.]
MKYSKEEVLQYMQEEDVKFIRLAFCDVFGKQKNISIMPQELSRAFEHGIAIDASAIAGFGDESHSDLFLHPDPDTLMPLPWRPEHGRVVRMFCSITYPDGTIFECDTRSLLKKAVQEAKEAGYRFFFGAEQEFYLFQLDDSGNPTKIPYDNASYMDMAPEDRGENIRREVCLTLEQMGIFPESSHHEEGPGQNEIDFRYSDPLTAADNSMTFQTVVKTIAGLNGIFADFNPKPLEKEAGNGFHINLSVKAADGADHMDYIIAGILDKISEMTIFLNPLPDSYKRFGISKAPG